MIFITLFRNNMFTQEKKKNEERLFDESYLLADSTRDGLTIRPLSISDYEKGHCAILSQLTNVGDVSKDQWSLRFKEMKASKNDYFILVVENIQTQTIVGTGSIFIEKKMIRNCGLCGHIEDIVVDSKCRGKNVGLWIIENLVHIAKQVGCYKVILDCSEKNVRFYENCGFVRKEIQMVQYLTSKL
jgi:glucosamine-phosphate N-acetyltransferase